MKEEEKWVFCREGNMEFGGVVFENREVRRMKKNFSLKEGMVVKIKSVYTGNIKLEMRYMLVKIRLWIWKSGVQNLFFLGDENNSCHRAQ